MKYCIAISICLIVNSLSGQCTHPDFDGLMELYNATNEDGWAASYGWHQASQGDACNPCDYQGSAWSGVICENDRVVNLNLINFGLKGSLPDFELEELKFLNLQENFLSGEIPNFSKIPKLEELSLYRNAFTGTIPDFDFLPSLRLIHIMHNFLEGSIPTFEKLNELASFDVGNNLLDGTIGDIQNKSKLFEYSCDNNLLTGSLPIFTNCPSLAFIQCSSNKLSGPIPDFAPSNNDLSKILLFCTFNEFEGCYTESVCDFGTFIGYENPRLPWSGDIAPFCMGENQLEAPCEEPGIPNPHIIEDCSCYTDLCTSTHPDFEGLLEIYDATNGDNWTNNNGWWQGKAGIACDPCRLISEPWYGVVCNQQGRVVCLDFDGVVDCAFNGTKGNNLTGALPEIKLDELNTLILDHNNLKGLVPDLSKSPKLRRFWCAYNDFEGELEINKLGRLEEFRGSFNQFSGTVPDPNLMPNLRIFSASNNMFTGCLPDNICDLDLFHVAGNTELPWAGDSEMFCEGQEQIGAPCVLYGSMLPSVIIDDCSCDFVDNIQGPTTKSFDLYPNPSAELLHINNNGRNLSYRITSIAHKVLINGKIEQQNNAIDISRLDSGIYLMHVTINETQSIVKKFVKI